jgi:hypothetical protein
VKAILALALLAVLGFTVAGCGSGKKANAGQYTVTLRSNVTSGPVTVIAGTTAISNVKTGTRITCKGGMSANVPRIGYTIRASQGVGNFSGRSASQRPQHQVEIELARLLNGSVAVTCNPATTAVLNVKTGTHIRCKGWTGKDLRVPRLGTDLAVGESVKLLSRMKQTEVMFLTHRENGAITVACELVEPR